MRAQFKKASAQKIPFQFACIFSIPFLFAFPFKFYNVREILIKEVLRKPLFPFHVERKIYDVTEAYGIRKWFGAFFPT